MFTMSKITTLTYLAIDATLLDFVTDTGSNHNGMLDSAATEIRRVRLKNKQIYTIA